MRGTTRLNFVELAVWVILTAAMPFVGLHAQTLNDISGPAEVPPASYAANQFVDSRGCVFVRAGFGGVVNWVPRVNRDQKVLCGYKPTEILPGAASGPVVPAQREPVTVIGGNGPAAVSAAPAKKVATRKVTPRKVTVALPVGDGGPRELRQLTVRQADAGNITCPPDRPRVQKYLLSDGRHLLRCAPPADRPGDYRILPKPKAASIPAGYRPAFKDGRLNPLRGPRSAEGDAAMAKVWSDAVPAERVGVPEGAVRVVSPAGRGTVPNSSLGGQYVQVGTFADSGNASRTEARIKALGFPAFANSTVMRGRQVQVILAGPFSGAEAASALGAIRRGGFGDAFLRG